MDKLNLSDPNAPIPTFTDLTWLREQNDPLPYVFIADDAFPLGKHFVWNHILRPILVI